MNSRVEVELKLQVASPFFAEKIYAYFWIDLNFQYISIEQHKVDKYPAFHNTCLKTNVK